jgi:excinuclease ABC subunit B
MTTAMQQMMEITRTRRIKQEAYNQEHSITPQSIKRAIHGSLKLYEEAEEIEASMVAESQEAYNVQTVIADLEREMLEAAHDLEFERAAALRDEIKLLKGQ